MADTWPPPPLMPRNPFREERWQLAAASGKPVLCIIVRALAGYEARIGYDPDWHDIFRTQLFRPRHGERSSNEALLEDARDFADAERARLLETGKVTESC